MSDKSIIRIVTKNVNGGEDHVEETEVGLKKKVCLSELPKSKHNMVINTLMKKIRERKG